MVIYFGADHRGFNLKEILKKVLGSSSYEVADLGDNHYDENDDYPLFASLVAEKVSLNSEAARGVVICGSGVGVDIVANKYPRVRSILGISPKQVMEARADDDVNVLSLAANFTKDEEAAAMLKVFLETPFSGAGRHERRLHEISAIEKKMAGG